jgi:hypothetical protein
LVFILRSLCYLPDHVSGIDAALEPAVHPQPVPVVRGQGSQGAFVAGSGSFQQFFLGQGGGAQGRVHI